MKLVKLTCPYCGSKVDVDVEGRNDFYCTYCGKTIFVDEENLNNTKKVKGRGPDDFIIDFMKDHGFSLTDMLKKQPMSVLLLLVMIFMFFMLI